LPNSSEFLYSIVFLIIPILWLSNKELSNKTLPFELKYLRIQNMKKAEIKRIGGEVNERETK